MEFVTLALVYLRPTVRVGHKYAGVDGYYTALGIVFDVDSIHFTPHKSEDSIKFSQRIPTTVFAVNPDELNDRTIPLGSTPSIAIVAG